MRQDKTHNAEKQAAKLEAQAVLFSLVADLATEPNQREFYARLAQVVRERAPWSN